MTQSLKVITSVFLISLLSACANSAGHEVVSVTSSSDPYLDCTDIRIAKANMRQIIDGVEKDKKDMTGADVVDGLLWFPFNVMAKQANYTNSKKAAEARLEHLTIMEYEKGCKKGGGDLKARKKRQAEAEKKEVEKKATSEKKNQWRE